MEHLQFDFNNLFSFNVGARHGATEKQLQRMLPDVRSAHKHLKSVIADPAGRVRLGLEWTQLPLQDKATVREIQELGNGIANRYDNVISLGIGGSYLGLKAAQDALRPPYYNEFPSLRGKRPRIYFEGNNLDPAPLRALLQNLNPNKTFVVVISKSGETTETKVALDIAADWLRKGVGDRYGRHVIAITDPEKGALRRKVEEEQAEDTLSFRSLPLQPGVGGRYSELNMGLLHLAIIGVKIQTVLDGAGAMAERCTYASVYKNPAYMYAALQTMLYRQKGKSIAVMMPFSETLKSTADWYAQLLAESLGKKHLRRIETLEGGRERWVSDKRCIVNVGRSPVPCRGTNDLHSIQQNNIEGENNKTVTFIRVEKFREDLRVPGKTDFLAGKRYSELIKLAQEATEWALVRENRPNCTIVMPEITPFHWGELIFFFEMATAFEGELLNVNAFDQPGVEGYKNYMYHKLGKPGVAKRIARQIERYPLKKRGKYIL
jgi:glucose-6-phosphate isomerase